MEIEQLMPHVEALIFASERPLPQMEMIELLGNVMDAPLEGDKVAICLEAVKEKYDTEYYPFELSETGGGYQFLTKKTYHQTVLQLNGDKYVKKLSASAMETLAIIVYKQPITKSDIEFIRGVSSDYSIQKLLEKELIMIAGRNEHAVGKPLLYATTKNFMDYLGINSTDQLPELKEIMSNDIVFPTNGSEAIPDSEQEPVTGPLFIDSTGELRVGEAQEGSVEEDATVEEEATEEGDVTEEENGNAGENDEQTDNSEEEGENEEA